MTAYIVETEITIGTLVPGVWVEGTSVGRTRRGRVAFRATWAGFYVGTQDPDPCDPFIAENGDEHVAAEPIHLFRDGHVNGTPQHGVHGFPVSQR